MDELSFVHNEEYERYEFLLFERDRILKEAEQYLLNYKLTFGKLITDIFEVKIECIKKKKIISYYMAAINHGGQINVDEMNKRLEQELMAYKAKLKEMLSEIQKLKDNISIATDHEIKRAKELYHKLAKMIHPDLNPALHENKLILILWEEIKSAYNLNDCKRLAELQIQVNKVIRDIGLDIDTHVDIPDLSDKIEALEQEIIRIRSKAPYTYIEFLIDDAAIAGKTEELNNELEQQKAYSEELSKHIDDLLKNGGLTLVWTKT